MSSLLLPLHVLLLLQSAQPRADSTNQIITLTRISKYTTNKLGVFTRIYYSRETRYTRASQVFSQSSLSNLLTTVRLTETHTCLNCYTRSDHSLVCRPSHDSRAHWRSQSQSQGPSGHPYNTEKGLID